MKSFRHTPNHTPWLREKGFSLVEVIVMGAAAGVVATIALGYIAGFKKAVVHEKLDHDVKTINSAISTYQSIGGILYPSDGPQQVLAKLKTTVTEEQAKQMPGLSGSVIDPRIGMVTTTETPDKAFAEWNPAKMRFEVVTDGSPTQSLRILSFELGAPSSTVATETRSASMKYATDAGWVWDYEDSPLPAPTAGPSLVAVAPVTFTTSPATPITSIPVSLTPVPPSPGPSTAVKLDPPTFSTTGGEFPMTDFPMSITLTNPNPGGSSAIDYWINGGPTIVYPGGTISVPVGATVSAYARSLNNATWADSNISSQIYTEAIPVPPVITFTMSVTATSP